MKNITEQEVHEEQTKRIKNWLEGKPMSPVRCMIFPTIRCNLKCVFCNSRDNPSFREEMSTERLLEIVQESKELGVLEWRISGGGEPLMHKGTFSMMMEIKRNGMRGIINTNGTLIDTKMAKKIVEIDWDEIWVSIDSAEPSVHDFLRGKKGTFERVVNALESISYWKKKLNKKKPAVIILTILTNKNYDKIQKLIEIVKKFNCYDIILNSLYVFNQESKKLELTSQQNNHFKKYAETYLKTKEAELEKKCPTLNPFRNAATISKRELEGIYCFEPFYSLQIHPNGCISPCCISEGDPFRKKINVNKISLKDIWFGSEYQNLRKCIVNSKLKGNRFEICRTCDEGVKVENDTIKKRILEGGNS